MSNTERTSVHVAGTEGLEKTDLVLGFVPLTDCAPLVVACEKGYFRRQGLEVSLSREASWANIRDKVALNALDGAQMLAPMPIAATLGSGVVEQATITAFSLGLNGNAITVSNSLYERMCKAEPEAMADAPLTARALQKVIEQERKAGKPPMTFAMVFPVSTHNYQLRYWMASAGIDPDRDVRLIVIPPPHMEMNLEAGNIDGYCVGEPWNSRAVRQGTGRVLITSYEIWNNCPEKVLGVKQSWAEKYPNTHRAMLMALLEASQWLDQEVNREEANRILAGTKYINAPLEDISASLTGTFRYSQQGEAVACPDCNVFYRYAANFPWRSHAIWFMTQMLRWGQIDRNIDLYKLADQIYRPDIYRAAAEALGMPVPMIDAKPEGNHATRWILQAATQPIEMGPDSFCDGKVYDPARADEYLASFGVGQGKPDYR